MPEFTIVDFWLYFETVLDSINLLLHSFGFYLQTKVRHGRFNANNMIVKCLSAIEILLASTSIACIICAHSKRLKVIGQYIFNTQVFMMGPMKFATILLITANRFMGCVHPITYRKYASKVAITAIVVITYTGDALVGSALWVVFDHHISNRKIVLCWLFLAFLLAVFILCVYAYTRIYTTLAASALRLSSHLPGKINLKLRSIVWNFIFHQGNATPLMIVVAFFVFVVVPWTWWSLTAMFFPHYSSLPWSVLGITLRLDAVSDALIYIYTDKDVKKLFLMKVSAAMQCRSNDVRPARDGFTAAFTTSARSTQQELNQ